MADRHDLEGYGVPIAAIFAGGVAARNLAALGEMRPKQALEHADKLRKSGASADVIHAETSKILAGTPYAGVTYGRDGKARFEISDDGAAVRRAPLDKAGRGFVGDMLHHPELYRAYPEAQLLGVERANFRGGGFDGRTVHIGDNHFAAQKLAGRPVVRDSVRGVALHELQHYAQDAEGFAPGASPDDFERRFPGEKNRALREKLYETTAGEVEAENTRARRNMTAQQRRATAPRQTETVPVSEQHLGPDEGRARTGEVRRVQRMVEKSPPAGRKPRSTKSAKPIGDLGEKIGGARKDTAVKTGPRIKKAAVVDTDPRPAWQRRFVAVPELDRTTKQPSGLWSLVDKETNSKWGGKTLARGLASEKAVLDAIPLAAVSQKHRVSSAPSGQEGYAIWRDVTDRKRVQIGTEVFPTRIAAMEHLANNAVAIIETKTGFGEEILAPPKPDEVFRRGAAVRKGDVAGNQFIKTFGFRGVEFGNWNNQLERQRVMNHAYDAFMDMAKVTGLDPKAMSLDGKLGLAFGARGTGGEGAARAHYERSYGVVNLTKMKGAGSLAHEWMHALDHFLARKDDPALDIMTTNKAGHKVFPADERSVDYLSHRVGGWTRTSTLAEDVRKSMKQVMDAMYYRDEQYVDDAAKVAKFADYPKQRLAESLAAIRGDLAREHTYGKRFNKPANAAQLAEFDALAAKILSGDAAALDIGSKTVSSKSVWNPTGVKSRRTNETLDGISAIMKKVRGRSGFSSDGRSQIDQLRITMAAWKDRQAVVADAAAQTVKTRKIPTDYSMNAKRIDQGRVSDYWQTRHEMAARAFSSYIEDKIKAAGQQSDFLSWGSTNDRPDFKMLKVKPFPEGAERAAINTQFETLFAAMKKVGTLPGAAGAAPTVPPVVPAAAVGDVPSSGLRGTQNPANLAAIVENRQANAAPQPRNADFNYPGAERYGAGPGAQVRAQARVNILNSASGGNGGWEAVKTVEGEWVVRHDQKTSPPAPNPKDYTPTHQPPTHEVRMVGGNTKKYSVYENGSAIKDASGHDKWFSSKEKAESYLAKRAAAGEKFGRDPVEKPTAAKVAAPKPAPRTAVVADDGGASEQAIKTAARLEDVAKRTIERAEKEAAAPRLMNTARRARMGGGIIDRANQQIADAKTALKIAEALRNGEAGALANVKSLADIRELRLLAREAEYATDRVQGRSYKEGGHGLKADDVGNLGAVKGYVRIGPSDVDTMKAALAGKKGLAADFRTLAKYAERAKARNSFETADSEVFKAVRSVANAIKQTDAKAFKVKYPHEVNSLKYRAGRLIDEARDFARAAKLAGTDPEGRQAALRAFLDVQQGKTKIDPAVALERNLTGQKIPGFFPTPDAIARRMAEMADIQAGQTVLEPSAGTGRLAAVAKAMGASVDAVEVVPRLQEVLKAKGLNVVASDFTEMAAEAKYDRILMNPPFEKGQDMAHVRRAYEMLKPGGKMVAVMGEGGFFRSDSQSSGFRTWLADVGGVSEKLPEGTFKESNTGVNTRLVTISKPGGVNPGWSDAARIGAAEARGVALPGQAKAPLAQSIASAADRAVQASEAARAKPQASTLTSGQTTGQGMAQPPSPAAKLPDTKPDNRAASRAEFMAAAKTAPLPGGGFEVTTPDGRKIALPNAGTESAAKVSAFAKIGNIVNKTGAIAMIAAPAAAAYVAYQGTRAPAVAADGTVKAGSRAEATANAAVAGGVVVGVGYGVMKVIGGAMKLAAKAAPKIAPALGPVGIGLGIAGMGYGAYQGYRRHGIKGAALGAIGADAVLDASKGAQPLPAATGSQGRLSPQQKQQFETANAAYQAMKAEATAQPKPGGWTDEARIAAYVERQKRAGSAASNAPYGGKPRKD